MTNADDDDDDVSVVSLQCSVSSLGLQKFSGLVRPSSVTPCGPPGRLVLPLGPSSVGWLTLWSEIFVPDRLKNVTLGLLNGSQCLTIKAIGEDTSKPVIPPPSLPPPPPLPEVVVVVVVAALIHETRGQICHEVISDINCYYCYCYYYYCYYWT
ncbi:hypothetical protein E2C01_040237 [Portunus trituberculatus]|uniref:Uncharacterized protein n=1 Tax=Portunus trituberculatus TaxID=210409 RepID=A0A5B7FMF7_PORTR|nr:hypothetical protein [Portunus trituberculatus]